MINIQKIGNAIVIDFTDNDKYLHDGTIEVAPNELMIVIDESDMATFKKMSNGDTLFGQLINQIQIQGEAVTKENIIDKFGMIGFASSGGGAVNSVNGKTGDVVITATSLGAITKSEADTLYAAKSDLNSKADISTVEALSTEVAANRTATTALTSKVNEDSEKIASLNTEMGNKANSADVPTNTQFNNLAGEVANKADKTSVYTKAEADEKYATNVELNHVKAELATKADTSSLNDYALKSEITGLATKEELANYQPIGDYATTTQLNSKQDTLVSGTNIKTVNGQSILGEGNIEISGGETITVDTALSETSENPVQNKVITAALNGKQAAGDYALKSETATKSELALTNAELEHKADKTSVYTIQEVDNKLATKQATLIQGNNITLSEPDSEGKVTISASQPDGLATKTELTEGLATKLDTSVYNSEKANFALKSEIPDTSGLATKEEISDMETKTSAAATYQPKGNYAGQQEVTDITANVTALQANKQDTLVSGTNIKTINGQSLLGEGNIEIQQPIASADTLGGVKVGTGLSINPESGVLSANAPEWNNISGKPEDIVNITERLASKLDTATYNSEKSSFATKDELNSKADASAIADMATQTWVQGQGYLTEVPSNYVTDSELTEGLAGKQNIGDYALKSDLNTLATKEELATKADASALSSKQDTLVSGTNIKTINGETILGAGDIVIQAGGTIDTAMSDTSENAVQNKVIKKYIDDLVGNILTQLQEINGTIA